MPYYFKLLNKSDDNTVDLDELDKILCNLVGEEPDESFYCLSWLSIIGFEIEGGKYLGSPELRNSVITRYNPHKGCDIGERELSKSKMIKILDYLEENFKSESWFR